MLARPEGRVCGGEIRRRHHGHRGDRSERDAHAARADLNLYIATAHTQDFCILRAAVFVGQPILRQRATIEAKEPKNSETECKIRLLGGKTAS